LAILGAIKIISGKQAEVKFLDLADTWMGVLLEVWEKIEIGGTKREPYR